MTQPEFGATAWGRAWLRAIERTTGLPSPQLPKARSLARNQKTTLDLTCEPIDATVLDGDRQFRVTLPLTRWSETQTATATTVAAPKTTSVVGDLPDEMVHTLTEAGITIAVPIGDIAATCTCRARTKPCVHVLTALYSLVLIVDERPRTALEIRGVAVTPGLSHDRDWLPLASVNPARFYTTG